nr:fimbrial protein [Providencia rettgeri]
MFKLILLTSLLIFSAIRSYGTTQQQMSIVGETVQSQFSMNVRIATCLPATIDNVSFGALNGATILSGEIEGHSTLSLDCSGTVKPQRVSLLFEPANPHLTMASSGYIASQNTTLGYFISWEDDQVGVTGMGIPMGQELFLKKVDASLMKIKLKIKPVVLPLGGQSVNLGSGNTHVTIKIKYIWCGNTMNKKIYFYIIPLIIMNCSQNVFADEILPDIQLKISLDVVNITCNINDGKGFNKIVDFKVINETDLLTGKQPAVKTQFIVDCQKSGFKPNNIDIKFRPGPQGMFNDGSDGKLKTNLSGVGIYLSWLDSKPIDLSGTNKRFSANSHNQFDISFWAKPYAQSQSVEKGIMKSSVIIDMLYKWINLNLCLTQYIFQMNIRVNDKEILRFNTG